MDSNAYNMEFIKRMFSKEGSGDVYGDLMPDEVPCTGQIPTKLRRTIGQKGSRKGSFNMPCGVAITQQGMC